MLPNGHTEVAVEGLEGDLDGVAGGRGGRRVTGQAGQMRTANGQRIRPRNWTTAASSPMAVATASTVGSASARVADTSTTAGASRTALMANPHQSRTRRLPPAAKRSRTWPVGWRRISG
jgi:hypothetical protein